MDWQNLPESSNVQGGRDGGGGGIGLGGGAVGGGAAIVIALLGWLFGVDTSSITGGGRAGGGQGGGGQTQTAPRQSFPDPSTRTQDGQTQNGQTQTGQAQSGQAQSGQAQGGQAGSGDQTRLFVSKILGSTEQVWGDIFQGNGRSYQPPHLYLFSGSVNSACGQASSAVGPFYCPSDQKVYLDTDFFGLMQRRLGGGGDFADAYVIAHEVGHHVQNLLGVSDQVERAQRSASSQAEANRYSVGLELQADCFAGVWGNRSKSQTNLTQADVQSAINTATAIGDDALQGQGRGYVVPDSFTHGSSQQRVSWFMKGFKGGDPAQCDTFSSAGQQINAP